MQNENKPIQIESQEWWYKGCFIQEFEHPELSGKYEVFKDTDLQEHVGRSKTFEGAIALCEMNEVKEYKLGYKQFIKLTDPMREPLVTKPQAFLLKAMGFNEVTERFYQIQSDKTIRLFPATLDYNHNEYSNEVAVPTHTQTLRWLREIKGLHVAVNTTGASVNGWFPWITEINTGKVLFPLSHQITNSYYSTYTEAINVGITEAFNILNTKKQ